MDDEISLETGQMREENQHGPTFQKALRRMALRVESTYGKGAARKVWQELASLRVGSSLSLVHVFENLKGETTMENTMDLMNIFEYDPNFKGLMKRLLENAMEHSFNGIMITKAEPGYPVVYVNDAFSEITGYSSGEIVGKSPSILQGPKTDGAVIDRLSQSLAEGGLFHGEAINYRKDGSEFVMEWKIVPIKNDKEVTSHYLAIQRDVTKLRDPL